MPKLSFAQTVAEFQETVAATRSIGDILPKLALTVADDLEAQVAAIKELKSRQRTYVAELKRIAEAKQAAIERGRVAARDIRACAVLVYGPRSARLTQFKLRFRRRPSRKTEDAAQVSAIPSASAPDLVVDRGAEIVNAPSEVWMTPAARANGAAAGAEVQPVGGNADQVGENASAFGGNAGTVGANAAPVRAIAGGGGGSAAAERGNAPALGGKSQAAGGNFAASPEGVIRAA